ncbi:MAG: hypothetical protein IK152_04210 [Lachnospiraceae bacterium]|nr:hypothetical protein [Lachnospiraceae bacterium]
MTAIEITDVKGFMGKLLASDTFDEYLILEAVITKANTFTIDGRLSEEYLAEMNNEVLAAAGAENDDSRSGETAGTMRLQTWGNVRNICYDLVKGKTLPIYMKVVLQSSAAATADIISRSGAGLSPEDVAGLYINITYDRRELRCVTGTSIRTFTLDKSLEHEWDGYVARVLKEYS